MDYNIKFVTYKLEATDVSADLIIINGRVKSNHAALEYLIISRGTCKIILGLADNYVLYAIKEFIEKLEQNEDCQLHLDENTYVYIKNNTIDIFLSNGLSSSTMLRLNLHTYKSSLLRELKKSKYANIAQE